MTALKTIFAAELFAKLTPAAQEQILEVMKEILRSRTNAGEGGRA